MLIIVLQSMEACLTLHGFVCRLGAAEEVDVRVAVAMSVGQLSPDACRGDERLSRAAAAIAAASSACPVDHTKNTTSSMHKAVAGGTRLACIKQQALQPFADTLLQLEPEPVVQVCTQPACC